MRFSMSASWFIGTLIQHTIIIVGIAPQGIAILDTSSMALTIVGTILGKRVGD